MDISTSREAFAEPEVISLRAFLERDIKHAQKVEFNIFIEAVFGIRPDILNDWTLRIREQHWLQDPKIKESLDRFCSASMETGRYEPLAALATRILELSSVSLPGIPGTYPIDDICFVRNTSLSVDTIPEHGPLGVQRRPGLLMTRNVHSKFLEPTTMLNTPAPGMKWSHIISSWEVKFREILTPRLVALLGDRRTCDPGTIKEVETGLDSLTTRKRASKASHTEADRKPTPPQSSTSTSITSHAWKRCKHVKIRLGSYALETLACSYGTRLFCVNTLIDDDRIHLWYYDACGVIQTMQTISLIDDFEKAAALIAGIACCPPERLGALPSSIKPPAFAPQPASWPPENLKDHILTVEHTGEKTGSITLKDPVFTQYSLTGRRTFVYNAEPNDAISKEEIIVKFSYQISTRSREQDLVRLARKAGVEHLPRIHLADDLFKMSEGIRHIFFDQGGIEYEDRTLRMIVYSRYFPLRSLVPEHPECLRDMVVQIITCLHDLKDKAGILHRDISVNNIMYELREGAPYFILIDYDMATNLSSNDGECCKPHFQEGTLPFMAVDLLRNMSSWPRRYTPHYLRHDYESVFWVCVWCVAVLIIPTSLSEIEAREDNVATVKAWETHDFRQVACIKETIRRLPLREGGLTLIGKATCLQSWFDAWSKFWWAIDVSWVRAVHARSYAEHRSLPPPTYDWETVDDLFTRDSLLSALRAGQEEHVPSRPQNELPQRTSTPVAHVLSDDTRPQRRSTRSTTAKTAVKEPQTTRGSQTLGTNRTATRKASTRKTERARGKSPPASPLGRKKRSNARAKAEAAKAAKKTTAMKAAAAKKGTTKVACATAKSVKNRSVPAKDVAKSKKKSVASQANKSEAARGEDDDTDGASTGRRGKMFKAPQIAPSTSITTKRARAAAKQASMKTAQAEANTTENADARKGTSRKRVLDEGVSPADRKSDEKDEGNKIDESVEPIRPDELDENDIRRRLRPRKRI